MPRTWIDDRDVAFDVLAVSVVSILGFGSFIHTKEDEAKPRRYQNEEQTKTNK